MPPLNVLRYNSKVIDKLADHGYFIDDVTGSDYNYVDISEILENLGIHEAHDDIIELLCPYNNEVWRDTLTYIGVERALHICDELGAQYAINKILSRNIKLDKIMDDHIINTRGIGYAHCILAFDMGYNIIPCYNTVYANTISPQCLNIVNAIHNGLLLRTINMRSFNQPSRKIMLQSALCDIIHIVDYNDLYMICDIDCRDLLSLSLWKNVERIEGAHMYDIPNFSGAKNIKSITSRYVSGEHIRSCVNLRELCVPGNEKIKTCAYFADSLQSLDISWSMMGNIGLHMCRKIKILNASYNPNITNCNPFASSLIVLYANGSCGITDKGLDRCTRIKKLHAAGGCTITHCHPFAKTLRILYAHGCCGIHDAGLIHCHKLKELYAANNLNITTIKSFPSLKTLSYSSPRIKEELCNTYRNIIICDSIYQKNENTS